MDVIKICFHREMKEKANQIYELGEYLNSKGYSVHLQNISNVPYKRWLENSKTMLWPYIMDVFVEVGEKAEIDKMRNTLVEQEIVNDLFQSADMYLSEQQSYRMPVNHAEIITSCYLWNHAIGKNIRENKMQEHFLMEQKQTYYDYLAFQCIKEILTEHSPVYEFFFESHVSQKGGIDQIYSKPELNGMREHSRTFLNVDTRVLSFGKIEIWEGKNNGI